MNRIVLLLLFVFLSFRGIPCDLACLLCFEFTEDDFVFGGEIIQTGEEFIQLKIIDQFRGNEQRDIITIWSGTDFECNGPWSMSANDFGNIGDTLLLVTRLIEDINNPWDVQCDYRRVYYCFSNSQFGQSDWVWDLWNGSMTYETFKEKWANKTLEGCENYEGDQEGCESKGNIQISVAPNPTFGEVNIITAPIFEKNYVLKIFDATGRWVLEESDLKVKNRFDLSQFPNGVYFISIFENGKILKTKRVVKI